MHAIKGVSLATTKCHKWRHASKTERDTTTDKGHKEDFLPVDNLKILHQVVNKSPPSHAIKVFLSLTTKQAKNMTKGAVHLCTALKKNRDSVKQRQSYNVGRCQYIPSLYPDLSNAIKSCQGISGGLSFTISPNVRK